MIRHKIQLFTQWYVIGVGIVLAVAVIHDAFFYVGS